MRLLIAIPALNEEESIASIIERCIAAKPHIIEGGVVQHVDITVVSDGSTDRTVEIASSYRDQIDLIVFEKNRGYGAAIKEAWSRSSADLLAFLDADGTCEPMFFRDLCANFGEPGHDIMLGCRINSDSRMPAIRRLGNTLFALLLTAISSTKVKDTASGMRVVRRTCISRIYPLPDGLHFTPAMSAKAMLAGDIGIAEIDMPYHERAGESKLHVIKDGLRFLRVILQTAMALRPSRPLGVVGLLLVLMSVVLMVQPVLHYLGNRNVQEWMIYRFVVFQLLSTAGLLLLAVGYLSSRAVSIALLRREGRGVTEIVHARFIRNNLVVWVSALLLLVALWLVIPSFIQLVETGATYEHWSRFIIMAQLATMSVIMLVTRVMDHVLDQLLSRLTDLHDN